MSVVYVWRLLRHGLADRVVTDHPLLVDLPLTEELLHLLYCEPLPQGGQHFPQFGGGHATRAVSIENPKNIFWFIFKIHILQNQPECLKNFVLAFNIIPLFLHHVEKFMKFNCSFSVSIYFIDHILEQILKT